MRETKPEIFLGFLWQTFNVDQTTDSLSHLANFRVYLSIFHRLELFFLAEIIKLGGTVIVFMISSLWSLTDN